MIQEALKMDMRQRGVILEETLELGTIQKKILRLRATRLFGQYGNHGALITIIDETRLQRLENMRREFTANVSHELKTPLAAIKAYAETLLLGALEDEEHSRKFVERISEQSSRLEALIQDLLKLARLQDSPQLRSDRVRLIDVIRQSVDSCAAIGKSQGVEIRVQPISEWLEIIVDREAVATILNNLVSNAVRYSHAGGRVDVSAECRDGQLIVEVADTGIGIAEEEHERIFERFYRVDKARSADSGGTGLGLAIVKNLATLMGGTIQLQSQLGKGSTFKVSVPVKLPTS
jgi:two-component system, OmpR family, phosphate regulon sensor histidine kinase PhoR